MARREISAIVQAVKLRRDQRVRRWRAARVYPTQGSGFFDYNDPFPVNPAFWSAQLLRAPPLSSIA